MLKTDVRSYYASIERDLLLDQLERFVPDRGVLNLLGPYLRGRSERGGLFWEVGTDLKSVPVCRGCPLSPIIGAFFLSELDQRLERTGLFFVRYMDDVLLLAPTRWKLRAAVKALK